jgi:purine-binding chemotaxis protein CheW
MQDKEPQVDNSVKKEGLQGEMGTREVIARVAKRAKREEEKIVPTEQLVTFELDKAEYASVITDLREIIKIPEIVPIPGAPEFIRGILNLRGQIIVVVDLEQRFHLKREHEIAPQHIIITEVEDSIFGILVDEVTGVLRVPQASIKPTPQLVTSKIHAEYLKGVVVLREETGTQEEKEEAAKTGNAVKNSVASEGEGKVEAKSRLLLLLDIPKMLGEKELLEFGAAVKETAQQKEKVQN